MTIPKPSRRKADGTSVSIAHVSYLWDFFDTLVTSINALVAGAGSADAHVAGDGSDHADVATNTTHVTSDGSDHTFIDQDVTITGSPTHASVTVTEGVVLDKASGKGIKIDTATPAFGWRDILGPILAKESGAGRPSLVAFVGNVEAFAFAANDKASVWFHIPHDYAPGTDVHLHFHWGHNGTAISGSLVAGVEMTYSKGHGQAAFHATTNGSLTVPTPDIATFPQHQHIITELQLSVSGGGVGQIDTDDLEPDGVLGIQVTPTTIPTITGGSPNEPFLLFADLHYQSTGVPTKNKTPNFYT